MRVTLTLTQVRVINEKGIPFNVTYEKGNGEEFGVIKIYDARKTQDYKFGEYGKELATYFCNKFRKQQLGMAIVEGNDDYYLDACSVYHIQNCLLENK